MSRVYQERGILNSLQETVLTIQVTPDRLLFGVLVWWTLLLMALIAFFIWFMVVIPPPSAGPETGYSGPQPGYGNGLLVGFVLIYTGAYAVVGLPFILFGTALAYSRRGVAY